MVLFLYTGDVLNCNLINTVDAMDKRESHMSRVRLGRLKVLEPVMCSCGISFTIREECM